MSKDRYKRPDLEDRYERAQQKLQMLSTQEIRMLYVQEMLKLKQLKHFGRSSPRFAGYPNTLLMNRCGRILTCRNTVLPLVVLPECPL